MISKRATRQFLVRKLKDSAKAKNFTPRALDAKIANIFPRPRFELTPRIHQKVCFLLGLKYPAYMYLLDMGLGKTKVSLDLIRYWIRTRKVRRALVLVPNTANIEAWLQEVAKHAPELKAVGMDSNSRADRLEALDSDAQLVICTYMGWLSFVCTGRGRKGQKGDGMKLDKKLCKQFGKRFQCVVWDEITAAKNHRSLTHRACRQLQHYCTYRIGLTGTPFGRDAQDLWALFYLIDRGETLGPTLAVYRSAFFTEKDNFWSGGKEYEFRKGRRKLLHRVLRHRSIRYSEDECLDLPKKVFTDYPVVFPAMVWQHYEKLRADWKKARGNLEAMKNTFVRMRQMASGFLGGKTPEGERVELEFPENPKLDALEQRILEVPPDRKIIVFHEFKRSGAMIAERLKKMKIGHRRLFSGTRDRREVLQAFDQDPKVRVLVASKAGALGLNLQVANYVFFYEKPVDPIVYKQMLKRAHRTGQTRTVFFGSLYVKNSVEEKIQKYLEEGEYLFQALVDGKEKL